MQRATLNNWSFTLLADNGIYTAPECLRPALQGQVHGHPRHVEGSQIVTSTLTGYDPKSGEFLTSNTRYTLGAVDPAYDQLYPNAKAKLIEQLS